MKKKSHFAFEAARVASDLLMVNFAFLFSFWFRFESGFIHSAHGIPDISGYIRPLPIISVLFLFIMRSFNLYVLKTRLSILDEFFAIVKSMTAGLVVLMAATFVYREFTYSRVMLFTCWVDLVIFVSAGRFLVNRIRFLLRAANRDFSNLLIIGTGSTACQLISHIEGDPHWNYNIVGVVSINKESKDKLEGISVLGEIRQLSDIISKRDIDEVILTASSLAREETMSIILECEKRMIGFHLVADLLGMITSRVDMENVDGIPLLSLKESPLILNYNRIIKRTIDIAGSAIGLILLSPIFIIVAIAVKLGSNGPVFYLQKRIGEDGRRFAIIKFRTMRHNAEKGIGAVWTRENDPRRTALGTFLRRNNIDELPQLINVLKGEMSLVGPRPERPKFVGEFKENIPRYMSRHKIRSGMTGWAQVNGLRGNTSIEERTRYDIYYIENWSLAFDIKIILMSAFQTLFSKSKHAY